MLPDITPIETVYNGHKFRSRLEARWAVWFRTLGIRYEYESDGYDLGKLGWYLPDFWVEEWGSFVEIKPFRELHCYDPTQSKAENERRLTIFTERQNAREKCDGLTLLTGRQVLMVEGNPWPDEYSIFVTHFIGVDEDGDNAYDWESRLVFAECRRCSCIWMVQLEGATVLAGWCLTKGYTDCRGCTDRIPLVNDARLMEAFTAARQERFS